MKNYYFFAIPIIIGIITGAYLSLNYAQLNEPQTEKLLTAKKLTNGGSPMLGNPSASITILEWGDYQCTYCYRFHESSLKIILNDYIEKGTVNLVFKDFPLNGPDSVLAAEAAYCAEDQDSYWEFHDELYINWGGERTGWVTRDSLNQFAQTVGLNLNQFNACLDDKKHHQRVLELEKFGKEIGIDATPSFLIFNDKKIIKIIGNQPIQVFHNVIDEF